MMYKPCQLRFQLILTIALVGVGFFDRMPGMAREVSLTTPHPQSSMAWMEPESPDTGTPEGDRTVGGTRPEATCKETDKPLTALFANNGSDFTLSEYPTFLFYVPYSPADISTIEFLLLDRSERRTIYRTNLRLGDRPGIIQISLPAQPENALEESQIYRWRLNLDCVPDRSVDPDLVLNGWIKRVALDSPVTAADRADTLGEDRLYRNNGIWYDAIAHLAQLYFANPNDGQANEAWLALLNELGLEVAIGEPGVSSEVVSRNRHDHLDSLLPSGLFLPFQIICWLPRLTRSGEGSTLRSGDRKILRSGDLSVRHLTLNCKYKAISIFTQVITARPSNGGVFSYGCVGCGVWGKFISLVSLVPLVSLFLASKASPRPPLSPTVRDWDFRRGRLLSL